MTDLCWICGEPTVAHAPLAPLPFRRCTACGFVFRSDRSAGEVTDVYSGGAYTEVRGTEYLAEQEARRSNARVRLAFVARAAPARGRLLDVGAAGGEFVAEAGAAGFTARGLEPTPSFARRAREELGVDVATSTVEDAALPPGELDVVTLWHVLEHIREPLDQLEHLRGALARGGALAIEVPNYGSAVAAHMGTAWPSLEPDVHVNQFAPATLRLLLERAGFAVAAVETIPITPYLPRRARLGPRHLAGRLKAAAWLRSPATTHPSGHELLRALAHKPA